MKYYYPKITSGGYRWNLLKKCLWEIGIEPIGISDVGEQTILEFSRELTQEEKSLLNDIMANDPQNPPSYGERLFVKDIQEDISDIKNETGLTKLRLFFTESVKGSGNVDRLCFWHPTPLTQVQKNKLRTAYTNLFLG